MSRLADWFDDRTGCGRACHELLYQRIPGGARWRYVWGTTLAFAVFVQFVTGLFLWMHYSPSTQTAWESVYYIEHQMTGGWLLRGIHHYTAHAVMVLMALHLMQVVIAGAYRAPREVNHWIGLGLMLAILALGQTGYLLPWDQRGYRATQIATTIAGATPGIGDEVRTIAMGGSEFGHHTLTRFFALHAGLLPGVVLVLLWIHLSLTRKHGLTPPPDSDRPATTYWPDQALRDLVACLAVLAVVVWLTVEFRAHLGPPMDPLVDFHAARPEWYFLFLFQLLKYFEGEQGMFFAAQLIPGLILLTLALMPFIGRWKLGHRFNVVFVFAVLVGVASLTAAAVYEDYNGQTEKSRHFLEATALAQAQAERAEQLAGPGIPIEGAKVMLRNDPKAAGFELFKRHCASCHDHYDTTAEQTQDPLFYFKGEEPTASNLYEFGSRRWMEGILDAEKIAGPHYFGRTIFADGDMVNWVKDTIAGEMEDMPEEEKNAFEKKVKAAAWAISAQAKLPYQAEADQRDKAQIEAGMEVVLNELSCIDCHTIGDEEVGAGPDLTGYGSHEWLTEFIKNPQTERFFYNEDNYDEVDKLMPGFAVHGNDPNVDQLTAEEIDLVVRWLRRDWPEP